jgi:hypothetical protein
MRELGAARATGDILVIRDDSEVDDPSWIASVAASLAQHQALPDDRATSDEWRDDSADSGDARLATSTLRVGQDT